MIRNVLLAACMMACIPGYCEAPVVDDSENYALLEEQQQVTNSSPVAHNDNDGYYATTNNIDEAQPLARDDAPRINSSNSTELVNTLQGLKQDIQELRGQLEIQAHDLKLLQEQQLSFYKDLDARINGAPTTKPTVANTPTPLPAASPTQTTAMPVIQPMGASQPRMNPADEQVRYLAAYELVKNKQFDEALSAMQAFVAQYPQGGYTGNAHYWLGELYMVKSDNNKAIEQFNIVLQQFPSSSKVAASLLKLGYALAASGQTAEAREKLNEVIKKYPDTTTAELASAKLEALSH